jgi:hypothetical protein
MMVGDKFQAPAVLRSGKELPVSVGQEIGMVWNQFGPGGEVKYPYRIQSLVLRAVRLSLYLSCRTKFANMTHISQKCCYSSTDLEVCLL